jgi:hypothetical protein
MTDDEPVRPVVTAKSRRLFVKQKPATGNRITADDNATGLFCSK